MSKQGKAAMIDAPAKSESPLSWLKRLWPLLLLVAAMAVVIAMGWHRYLNLEELADRRDQLRAAIAANTPLALLVFIGVYAGSVALSLPGATLLTLAGGILFGWFFRGDELSWWLAVSGVCVATGILLVNLQGGAKSRVRRAREERRKAAD